MKTKSLISKKSCPKQNRRGFTLIEVILVIGLIGILIFLSIPFYQSFQVESQLDSTTEEVVNILRRAQSKAMASQRDSNFGVKLTSGQYTLFKGDSYAAREVIYDEDYNIPETLSINGLTEIVFNKLKGTTSNTGNITVTSNNNSKTININETGRVEIE